MTRLSVFSGSHNSLSINLKLVKARQNRADRSVLSCARSTSSVLSTVCDQFSVLTAQIHTQQSKCLLCRAGVLKVYIQRSESELSSQVTYVTMVPRMGNETLRPLGVATGNALSVTRV